MSTKNEWKQSVFLTKILITTNKYTKIETWLNLPPSPQGAFNQIWLGLNGLLQAAKRRAV